MPPKKDNKKEAAAKPDNSGIPKVDAEFKFTFSIVSDSPEAPNYAIMFEWYGNISDKMERYETTTLEAWKKEENNYTFEKDCDPIRIDDDFCKNLSNKRFFLYFVNAEDSKVEDQLTLDYSCLLMPKDEPPKFSFKSNTVRVLGIDSFEMSLSADKPLMEELYRHYLNPFEVEVIGAKDLPIEKSTKYEATYVKYSFYDGSVAQTQAIVGTDKLLWSHKHVFLAGLMDPVQLKEKMRSNFMKFELHDRDEINNKKIKSDVEVFDIAKAILQEMEKEKPVEQDPKKKGAAKKEEKKEPPKKDPKKDAKKKDAKLGQPILPEKVQILNGNYGVSACNLVQFLKPTMRTGRYKVPVVPRNTFEDVESRNIDLNTTARNEMQKVIASNNYFDCDTVLVVGFTLAHPIGTFQKPVPSEQPVPEDPKKKKDAKEAAPAKAEAEPAQEVKKDVFERVVYILPYRDAEWVKRVQDIFYSINLKAFKFNSKRQLTNHLLSSSDKDSFTLDYVTGLQIVDPEGRIYIIQGLKDGSMKQFHQQIAKAVPKGKDFKIFKNSSIVFSARMFKDFNLELKRIRLRPNLNQLLLQPSLYIKSKLPSQIGQNLNKLADIRKVCEDLATIDAMNLWPSQEWLIQIERKFSQSLSVEDLTGQEMVVKQKKQAEGVQGMKTIKLMENTDLKVVTSDDFFLPKIPAPQNTTSQPAFGETFKRTVMTKTFTKDQQKQLATYTMRGKSAEIPSSQPVYIYGGQRNNFYEKQKRELRESLQKNPKAIMTYSKDHLGLSIDPYDLTDEAKREQELMASKVFSKDKFSSLLIRTKEERMKLPKRPGDEDISDLKNYPYHQQKDREKEMKKNYRDLPPQGKNDFQKYIRPQEIFSQYQPVEGEKVSLAEKQKEEREQKRRVRQEQKDKCMGDPTMKIKKGYFADKSYGADRFKDIREGQPKKLGFVDVSKRTKEKRPVLDYQPSYNLKEQVFDPSFNPLIRRDDPSQNIQKDEFNFYQRPQVLTKTHLYKPLRQGI